MAQVTVTVEVEVNPTEDEEKVRVAVNNVLGGAEIKVKPLQKGNLIVATATGQASLVKLRNMMCNDCVRDASRRILHKSTHGNTINFYLNKQVAYAGHVSFSEETAESPLGPIHFTIEADDARQLIEWLAEKTER
jgi:predicted RNA binding protein with dsRBD fold (UPF0201 family)